MATKPILARLDLSIASRARFFRPAILADYWALTKPEVNFLILITTFAGFYLARAGWMAGLPILAVDQCAARHIAGCQWHRHLESIH